MKRTIRKNENFGEILTLDDGTRWKVNPLDKNKAGLWGQSDEVDIDDGFLGKHKITNIKRKENVEARIII